MERLTERTVEGQAIPRMDLKNNGHQKCMERLAEYEDTELTPEEVMAGRDGRLLIGWIPVEERLPDEPNCCDLAEMEGNIVSLEECIVMIEGADEPTCLYYAGDGEWYRDGDLYKVIAWMPLPERYRLEK